MGINKQQTKRWWDLATLGKFKWYLVGVFFLLIISKFVSQWGVSPYPDMGPTAQYVSWQAQYEVFNALLYLNNIWVNSDLWKPIGMTFSGTLVFLLSVAYLRGE